MSSITPARSPIGTYVYIHGVGFSTIVSENTVTIGVATATVSEASENRLKIIIPALIPGEKWVTLSVNNSVPDSLFPFTVIPWGIGPVTFGPQELVTDQVDGNHDVYASDLDGDGDNDILSISYYDHKIGWYENIDGNGTFGSQQIISNLAHDGQSVTSADIDGDGDMDVLSASAGNNIIAWYENLDGLGSFGNQNIITDQANRATEVFSVDLDGDGDMDVLSASAWDNKIAWYENTDGMGAFGSPQIISSNAIGAQSVFATDVDGDGDMDVLSASPSDQKIAWYENLDGLGTFGGDQIITLLAEGVEEVITADLDGDGDMDVLSAGSQIAWYENTDGLGTFGPQLFIDQAIGASDVWATDIDSDGDMDVLSASHIIAWYENTDGFGAFGDQQIISITSPEAFSIYTSDLDGDWDQDIIAGSFFYDKIIIHKNTTQQDERPLPPIQLTALRGDKNIQLSWSHSLEGDFSQYKVYRGDSVTVDSLITVITNRLDTTHIDTGLTNGIRYYYNISVVDTFGLESPRSNTVSAVPNRAPDWYFGDTLIFIEDETSIFALDSILFDDSDPLDSIQIALVSGTDHFTLNVDYPNNFLSVTPGENYNGESTLVFLAEDPSGDSRADTVLAIVQPVNDPPVLPPDTVLYAIEDTVFTYRLFAWDVDNDTLSFSVSALPSWLSFMNDSLFGIANGSDTATSVFIIVDDGIFSDTQRVDIQIIYRNDAPRLLEPFPNIYLPFPMVQNLLQDSVDFHFWDEESGNNLVFQVSSPSTLIDSVTIQEINGVHQIWLYAMPDLRTVVDIGITARDSDQASISDGFKVFLGYTVGQPIITALKDTNIFEDHNLDLSIQAYDLEGDSLFWSVNHDTSEVIATFLGDTLLHIHPQPNWWGQTTLEVRVSDGLLIDSTVFTLTVQPVNDPPVLSALPDTVMNEDGILNIPIDYQDPDDSTLTLEATVGDTNVQIVINPQLIKIQPDTNWFGNSWITWSVSDQEYTRSDSFSIMVFPMNDRPNISIEWEEEPITGQTSFNLIYHDDDSDTLTFQGEFSYDTEADWYPIILSNGTKSLIPSQQSQMLSWNSIQIFPSTKKYWGIYDQVVFRIWAIDSLSSSDTIMITKSLLNFAGDYNENQKMDAVDIGYLLKAYFGQGDTVASFDIGPSVGEEPYLISDPDSIINFEDLATFSQTWYYDVLNNAIRSPRFSGDALPDDKSNTQSVWSIQQKSSSDSKDFDTLSIYLIPEIDLSEYYGMDIDLFYENLNSPGLLISTTLKSLPPDQIVLWKQEQVSGYFKLSMFSRASISNNEDNKIIEIQFPKNKIHLINDIAFNISTILYTATYTQVEYFEMIQLKDLFLVPKKFALYQNFPNPFNPLTTIRYDLPEKSFVNLTIYDILGRKVKTLVNTTQDFGYNSVIWDATNEQGKPVSAGVYLYKIDTGKLVRIKKMILLK